MDISFQNILLLLSLLLLSFPADSIPTSSVTRDICIIGGGSSGTYAAIRLTDAGQSVLVLESTSRMGGHTETYVDPATGLTTDIGVVVFQPTDIVRAYFARYNISLGTPSFAPTTVSLRVDFRTGETATVPAASQTELAAALERYLGLLKKYPELRRGYHLREPVPEELLEPFKNVVERYELYAALPTINNLAQGIGDILELPALYPMRLINENTINARQSGFLSTTRKNNSELYKKALLELGENVILRSRVEKVVRGSKDGFIHIMIKTLEGSRYARCKKLLFTTPPTRENLRGMDLDNTEKTIFEKFKPGAYYTGVLRNIGIPDDTRVDNIGSTTPENLPALPGIYGLSPAGIPGHFNVKYGAIKPLPEDWVKKDIVNALKRLKNAGLNTTAEKAEFAVFKGHVPFQMKVGVEDIRRGFYRELYGLQGRHNTWYTGAAFNIHDSSALWAFTEELLPKIME